MARDAASLQAQKVLLPWVVPQAGEKTSTPRPERDGGPVRYAPSAATPLGDARSERIEWHGQSARAPTHLLQPALRSVGLPYRPHPSLDESDREGLDLEALSRAAVGLDVLGTELRKLEAAETILADMVGCLAQVASYSSSGDDGAAGELIDHALGTVGKSRVAVAAQLAKLGSVAAGNDGEQHADETPTQENVDDALARIEALATQVVREMRLRLERLLAPSGQQA